LRLYSDRENIESEQAGPFSWTQAKPGPEFCLLTDFGCYNSYIELFRAINFYMTALKSIENLSDTALRMSQFFGTSAEFWINLQQAYDLKITREEKRREIEMSVRPLCVNA
jgi:hypothetical protein